jgi:hypothetical protein
MASCGNCGHKRESHENGYGRCHHIDHYGHHTCTCQHYKVEGSW